MAVAEGLIKHAKVSPETVVAHKLSHAAEAVRGRFFSPATQENKSVSDPIVFMDIDGTYLNKVHESVGVHIGHRRRLERGNEAIKARQDALVNLLKELGEVPDFYVWSAREPNFKLVPGSLKQEIEAAVGRYSEETGYQTKVHYLLGLDKQFNQKSFNEAVLPHIQRNQHIVVIGNSNPDKKGAEKIIRQKGDVTFVRIGRKLDTKGFLSFSRFFLGRRGRGVA